MVIITNKFKEVIWTGGADMDSDTFKVGLLIGTSAVGGPDINFWQTLETADDALSLYSVTIDINNINADDIVLVNTGYTTSATNNATKRVWTANNAEWPNCTVVADALIIYDTTRSNLLVCYMNFPELKVANAGSFVVAWNANGILNLSS